MRRLSTEAVRIAIVALGVSSIAWGVASIALDPAEAAVTSIATRILLGEKFSAEQMSAVRHLLDTTPSTRVSSSTLDAIAVGRLGLLESDLTSREPQHIDSDRADAQRAVRIALTENPTNSFLWLAEYWLQVAQRNDASAALNLLQMSYWMGPNEAWIAIRRNPLALAAFPALSQDVTEEVVSEFVSLIRSGLYLDAANAFAGPGWPIREKLLSRLVQVSESDRRGLARALEAKDLDGYTMLGFSENNERPF